MNPINRRTAYAEGKVDEAIAEYRAALRLAPDDAGARTNLGIALDMQGRRDEAIAELREAIRLRPEHVEAHANLGLILRTEGNFGDAIAELRRAVELAGRNLSLAEQLRPLLQTVERQALLAARLEAVLQGADRPKDPEERLAFAALCYDTGRYAAAARLLAEAFEVQPAFAKDVKVGHRYDAARAAALAGCGKGRDTPPLGGQERARWRAQALTWLKAELAGFRKLLRKRPARGPRSGPAETRALERRSRHGRPARPSRAE
jgi:serine/threonine-protein kinase